MLILQIGRTMLISPCLMQTARVDFLQLQVASATFVLVDLVLPLVCRKVCSSASPSSASAVGVVSVSSSAQRSRHRPNSSVSSLLGRKRAERGSKQAVKVVSKKEEDARQSVKSDAVKGAKPVGKKGCKKPETDSKK